MTAPTTLATARLLSADARAEPLGADGAADGPMPTACAVLAEAPADVGVWEAAPGTDSDVEADELFVVLAGRGTVCFDDGSEIALQPGTVVHLRAGDRTTWTVTETLRKVYVLVPPG